MVESEKADVVVVSGDVYDRALPHVDAVALADETFARLAASRAKVVVSSGNHDSAQRLGFGSRMVVTGDITQVDLPRGTKSGLRIVRDILSDVDDVHFSELTAHDVVRHKLVGRIVAAYDTYEAILPPAAPRRPGRAGRPTGP